MGWIVPFWTFSSNSRIFSVSIVLPLFLVRIISCDCSISGSDDSGEKVLDSYVGKTRLLSVICD